MGKVGGKAKEHDIVVSCFLNEGHRKVGGVAIKNEYPWLVHLLYRQPGLL